MADKACQLEKRSWLVKMKSQIESLGLKTTWRNPVFDWIHSVPPDQRKEETPGDTLYVADPPVPRLAPFDLAAVSLKISDDSFYFNLCLYYYPADLQQAVEADEIGDIWTRHAAEWNPKIAVHFNDIAMRFSFQWDTEYQDLIEDTLWGNFPLTNAGVDQVIEVLREMKRLAEETGSPSR